MRSASSSMRQWNNAGASSTCHRARCPSIFRAIRASTVATRSAAPEHRFDDQCIPAILRRALLRVLLRLGALRGGRRLGGLHLVADVLLDLPGLLRLLRLGRGPGGTADRGLGQAATGEQQRRGSDGGEQADRWEAGSVHESSLEPCYGRAVACSERPLAVCG